MALMVGVVLASSIRTKRSALQSGSPAMQKKSSTLQAFRPVMPG